VSFDLNLGGNPPVALSSRVNPAKVLYVCPVADLVWDEVSSAIQWFKESAQLIFFFAFLILLFSWGWAFYQNLLKDKFNEDVYKNPWALTKITFWCAVVFIVLLMTPNHFRRVDVRGSNEQWVLCENTSDGAKPTSYKRVSLH
jgi:hypothetical protein